MEPLTNEDVRALKKARGVVFHHNKDEGEMHLVLDTWHNDDRVWTKTEQVLFPKTNEYNERRRVLEMPSGIRNFDQDHPTNSDHATCFEYLQSARVTEEWVTAAESLKAGDYLTLRWTASNNAGIHREVGYHNDELRLQVDRPMKSGGTKRLTFLLSVNCRPNNSARMVRPSGA